MLTLFEKYRHMAIKKTKKQTKHLHIIGYRVKCNFLMLQRDTSAIEASVSTSTRLSVPTKAG